MSKEQLLTTLRTQVIRFLEDLRALFPTEADLIIMSVMLSNDNIPMHEIMTYVQTEILPLKKQISERNERFFLDHNILFEKLDDTKVNRFKELWLSPVMDKENKDSVWRWFDVFVKLAEKHASLA